MSGESESEEGEKREEKRRSWKDCCFGVESKEFEIGVEEKKGKPQVVIVESKRGVTSWVRLGLVSVGFLVESLNQCIKDEREGKWERGWKENGRMYSLVRMVNRAGCFLRLRVVDMELKKFNICIPKGRGERRGWILMEESLRKLGEKLSSKENKQEERAVRNHSMKGSYAEIVKRTRGRVGNSVRVEVRGEEINKNLNKLEHCLVGSWNSTSARGEDLERLGWLMADVWGLKGKLGLARLEKGRVLLEFELVGEAKRVLFSGKRSVGGIQLGLERWDSRSGCEEEGEIKNEVWVRIFGLPVSLWVPSILRRVGEECGGFLDVDPQTENLEELQWARILVKTNDGDLPSMLEIGVGGVRYSLTLWWEIRPKIRDNRESFGRSEGEVRGDADSRAGVRVEDLEIARLEAQLLTADGTDGQLRGSGGEVTDLRAQVGLEDRPPIDTLKDGPSLPGHPVGLLGSKRAVGPLPHGPPVARLLKDAGVDGAGPVTGPACSKVYGLKVRPGPTQSQISWAHFASCNGHNAEAEFFRLREKEIEKKQQKEGSHSATDCALDEEASRYGFALNSGGVRVLGSSSSFHLSFGRTPEGEFFDHSGALREEESPLCILNVDETVGNGSACWDLVEAKCGYNKVRGSVWDPTWDDHIEDGGETESKWEESSLAKFSQFLGFSTQGLEKDILNFLAKIRKRREKIYSKGILEKTKFERELKRLECSINYEGGSSKKGQAQDQGGQLAVVQ